MKFQITQATERDAPVILQLIRELAEYERLLDKVTATEDLIRQTLFGPCPAAEVLLASVDGETVGYALFYTTYSTFLGKPGLYLEDLFVKPHAREHYRQEGNGQKEPRDGQLIRQVHSA